ncbi:MAG TPA: hypothetical protein VK173_07800 [Lacibacter sp.]|nr:hypothetical protein [Lacibacter sp.]
MQDIKLNINLDLEISGGDLVTGESTQQHQQLLLATVKGDWKENPTIAVGLFEYLKDNDGDGLLGEIKQEFERDGMIVNSLSRDGQKINVDASYK